jgi:spermidine synthase
MLKLNVPSAYLVVFVTSGCTLVLEIVAGRMMATYIGVSLYTWTSIIGIVLAGISLGSYVGGKIADRWASPRTLGMVLLGGGLASLLVLPLSPLAGVRWLFKLDCGSLGLVGALCTPQVSTMSGILLVTTAIFLPPSLLLGMVSPIVVRLSLSSLNTSGATVGKIYAFSTLGSILGAFMTGLWLISAFGARQVLLGVGLLLVLMGSAFGQFWRVRRPAQAVLLAGGTTLMVLLLGAIDRGQALASRCYRETDYFCIKVYDLAHERGSSLRALELDHLVHSYSALDDPMYYEYPYIRLYAELTDYVASARPGFRALFIGGGGYTLPRGLEVEYPGSTIEVIEIDPGVTRVAYEMMGLPSDTRILTRNLDARLVLEQLQGGPKYDLVFGDAFNDLSVPYHLTTLEFGQKVRAILADDGLYLLNVIDRFNGGLFLPSVVRTLKQAFPHVYLMSSSTPWESRAASPSTYVVAAAAAPLDEQRLKRVQPQGVGGNTLTNIMPSELLEEWLQASPGVLLTDDYAPADNLVAPLFAERGS